MFDGIVVLPHGGKRKSLDLGRPWRCLFRTIEKCPEEDGDHGYGDTNEKIRFGHIVMRPKVFRLKAEGYEILHEYAFFVLKDPSVFSLQPSKFFIGIGQPATSRDKVPVKGIHQK